MLTGLTHGFCKKSGHLSNFFFLDNLGHRNVFYDILERKNAFLGCKDKKFKKSMNCHFSKMVNPWFWSKNGHISNFFFLGVIGQENVFYDILEQKSAFLGHKKQKVQKVKKLPFFQREKPMVFFHKWPFLQLLFFWSK